MRRGRPSAVWRQLRATIPDRTGVLILDGTSFPKQGTHSVGVARQYCGALGKIANCQVAVTVALWTGARAWMLGAALYLPEAWLTPDAAQRARIPPRFAFQAEMAAGAHAAAPGARQRDHGHGGARRCRVRRERDAAADVAPRAAAVCVGRLVDADRVSSARPAWSRPRHAPARAARARAARWRPTVSALEASAPWPRRSRPAPGARHVAQRHEPAVARPLLRAARHARARLARRAGWRPRSGCCANAIWAPATATKYYLVNLPATASLRALVRLAHQRWAIEQQYQELKDELGLDHFEGRSLPGWHRHVVLTALAYTWLQRERRRAARRCRRCRSRAR